jgi:hypothetical protein
MAPSRDQRAAHAPCSWAAHASPEAATSPLELRMDRTTIRHAITFAALLLGTALPAISHGDPCPPMPRRYTPTMEHQIGDEYHVYGDDDLSLMEQRIDELTLAYHNRHPGQSSDGVDPPKVPTVPEPDFIQFFGGDADPPGGHFQNVTRAFHKKSPDLHRLCAGKSQYCAWAWGVNPKHNDFNASFFRSPTIAKNLRCRPEGVTLIGYVLPGPETRREDDDFLVTIADLKKEHLPYLKALKTQTLTYLGEQFGYDPAHDTAQLYFHWPTGLRTSVLHLHSKINFSMSPTESLRAFTLDEVIHALENNERGVTTMIARRWTGFGGVLLEKSDADDVRLWSILNGGKEPTKKQPYFKWISDHVKGAWYDSATKTATVQLAREPGKEMTKTALITQPLTASYGSVIRALLPDALRERVDPTSLKADPNFYGVVRCLYPAALKLDHPRERDTIYNFKCLHYDRASDQIRMQFSLPEMSPPE